jgi:hypothetical protein
MNWASVILFIITNAPSLIKAIRELITLFNGDRQTAAKLLDEMHSVMAKKMGKEDRVIALGKIMEKYRKQVSTL